ncbi:DNA repair ATPase [Verrucomicrobiales bacterium]|nr:DNA repair ATPase [Verrucomicrobiales bacterium]
MPPATFIMPEETLESGAYEVIRQRLQAQGDDLRGRLESLNRERQDVFGAIEPSLIATERVTTQHNCVPRDMVAIGQGRFLFGFNVHIGLKSTTAPSDVFAAYHYENATHAFTAVPLDDILGDDSFLHDFGHLYKYYRDTVFAKFLVIGPHLYMAFRAGRDVTDVKTFKWLLRDDGTLVYQGNRSDHEYRFPRQQDFEWTRAHRDMQRGGEHPHVSIEDRVFVETVGGDLTVKVEDNTSSGEGIYAEPVTEADQTLDDAEIFYTIIGSLIVLKIRPYQENDFRYLVFNEKLKTVQRFDAIENACVLLPDEHGIIFSNGFHLQSGETKLFESGPKDMIFERRLAAPNGEDHLYVFYNRASGDYVLMSYNIIDQQVDTPISCSGYSVFEDGELIYFRTEDQPQKHHALQVWQTPYIDADAQAPSAQRDHYLYKLGNADIVRCMAECHEVLNLLGKDDAYANLYHDLAKKASDVSNSYFWVGQKEAYVLSEPLGAIQTAAESAIAEFEKVTRLRKSATAQTTALTERARKLISKAEHSRPDDIMGYVHHLAELRGVRGEVISLRDVRYVNIEQLEALESEVQEVAERVSGHCVEFLIKDDSLRPYRDQVEQQQVAIEKISKAAEGKVIDEELGKTGEELEMLIDIVSNLKIEDATQTTQIIDGISDIYGTLNQVRVTLKNTLRELGREEGAAQFQAQLKLLNQAVVNYLELCDSPEKCESYLSKTMVQLEELEGKYAEFDDYVAELGEKRTEIYDAFEARKVSLLESRNKRAANLEKSAERIFQSIHNRLDGFQELHEINAYLASDLMIEKVRDIVTQLQDLGDSVKADAIQAKLKSQREDAVRQLKDRKELFVDGKAIIQLGKHRFSVNQQTLELTVVPRDEAMCFHLTGTNFFEPIKDPVFLETQPAWSQEVLSESSEVYRGEYLAYRYFQEHVGDLEVELEVLRKFMAPRYAEGYTKGVHDHDAFCILKRLLPLQAKAGLLRYDPAVRAQGIVAWRAWKEDHEKQRLFHQLESFGAVRSAFDEAPALQTTYIERLQQWLGDGAEETAAYLFHEMVDGASFTVSAEAASLVSAFQKGLATKRQQSAFEAARKKLAKFPQDEFEVIRDWLRAFDSSHAYLDEAAAHLLRGGVQSAEVVEVPLESDIDGMLGNHAVIAQGNYHLHYTKFLSKLARFERQTLPLFQRYTEIKHTLTVDKRELLRLDEFKPRIMSSFVRNRLLDEVYLPMIGDNLAKQIGVAGADTRTDRMGLLLLISPPGYGKTTLMEYMADRLGLTFVKVNGPALGHQVRSLDPVEAPNASAREEVKKLNLSIEMGDNVMIYLDDIQHCDPEFLQKFISLCDGQRRIEGVYDGVARTYDLRGRKVAVVMAGNPYTESGGKFQIPDMLANRADTYNLGDIVGTHQQAFEDSYLENCLTSNAILAPLGSRSQKDVHAIIQIARNGAADGVDFEGNYTPEEVSEMVDVMTKLMRVRDTVLRVNLEYIRSAAQSDEYRTEPPFKLQGSYRNMNRMAEKILPIMTEEEVINVIKDHYENESQTLTTGAEANLLKFQDLEGFLTEEDSVRWEEIKKTFARNLLTGGAGDNDPVSRVVGQLAAFNASTDRIQEVLAASLAHQQQPATLADATIAKLEDIINKLRAVPVDVDINVQPVQESSPSELPVKVDAETEQGDEARLPPNAPD